MSARAARAARAAPTARAAAPAGHGLTATLAWGLIPAVPVPFRGRTLATDALDAYAAWMARHDIPGVAVWAHTGRGPHLAAPERRRVLTAWRAALPRRTIVAGATSVEMAAEAKALGADALLAFPRPHDPVAYHAALGRELPVIAFYLYGAAGGTAYDDRTLHALLELPVVIGIKVATLDSVVTFQHIAHVMQAHPEKLLVTGEDRFLGYSLMLGARAALVGMGAALTELQVRLLTAYRDQDFATFLRLASACDAFGAATFGAPVEGYIRRMLWALAADGVIPDDACDDPWGPTLPESERDVVRRAVRAARERAGTP